MNNFIRLCGIYHKDTEKISLKDETGALNRILSDFPKNSTIYCTLILYIKFRDIIMKKFTKTSSFLMIVSLASKIMVDDVDCTCCDLCEYYDLDKDLHVYELIMCNLCDYKYYISSEEYDKCYANKTKYLQIIKTDLNLNFMQYTQLYNLVK